MNTNNITICKPRIETRGYQNMLFFKYARGIKQKNKCNHKCTKIMAKFVMPQNTSHSAAKRRLMLKIYIHFEKYVYKKMTIAFGANCYYSKNEYRPNSSRFSTAFSQRLRDRLHLRLTQTQQPSWATKLEKPKRQAEILALLFKFLCKLEFFVSCVSEFAAFVSNREHEAGSGSTSNKKKLIRDSVCIYEGYAKGCWPSVKLFCLSKCLQKFLVH